MIATSQILSPDVIEAAKDHARREYPKESCGIVFRGAYIACENVAKEPEKDFEIAANVYATYSAKGGIEAVLHSHPGGPMFPTEADMAGQIATGVPWGLIPLILEDDVMRVNDPIMWGDGVPKADLIGRTFIHGIQDCYSLIRDAFALGREGLAAQGVTNDWPFEPRFLPEVPRDDGWWAHGKDLYRDGLEKNGFRIIKPHEARAGDGFLIEINVPGQPRYGKLNHAGLLVTNDTLIHHLPMRLSRREPAGLWGRNADLWVRHEG